MYYIPCTVTIKHEHNQQSNFQSSQVLCKFVAVDQPTHTDIMCKQESIILRLWTPGVSINNRSRVGH